VVAHGALTLGSLNGYAGIVTLSCSGLPTQTTCTFSPASVTIAGTSTAATVTIQTTLNSISSLRTPTPLPHHRQLGWPTPAYSFAASCWLGGSGPQGPLVCSGTAGIAVYDDAGELFESEFRAAARIHRPELRDHHGHHYGHRWNHGSFDADCPDDHEMTGRAFSSVAGDFLGGGLKSVSLYSIPFVLTIN